MTQVYEKKCLGSKRGTTKYLINSRFVCVTVSVCHNSFFSLHLFQGLRATTVRITWMTVLVTSAWMEEYVWMELTPTTASVHQSGPVRLCIFIYMCIYSYLQCCLKVCEPLEQFRCFCFTMISLFYHRQFLRMKGQIYVLSIACTCLVELV